MNRDWTEPGRVNDHNQVNLGRTDPPRPGTDHNNYVYVMRCGNCGYTYGANGSDIFQRRCPDCDNGAEGLYITDEEMNWPDP